MFNKNHTEESKEKISKSRSGVIGRESGWEHTSVTKEIISEKRKEYFKNGGLNSNAKMYNVYDLNDMLVFTNVSSYDIIEKLFIDMKSFKTIMAFMRRNNFKKIHPKHEVRIEYYEN
jgi:hypothetical protein